VAACGGGTPQTGTSAESTTSTTRHVTDLKIDLSGFLDTSETHCYHGGLRPCAAYIRPQPNVDPNGPFINARKGEHVAWPLENHDSVQVACYTENDQAPDGEYTGSQLVSPLYYRVIVPPDHIVDHSAVSITLPDGSAVGYIPILDFAGSNVSGQPDSRVSPC